MCPQKLMRVSPSVRRDPTKRSFLKQNLNQLSWAYQSSKCIQGCWLQSSLELGFLVSGAVSGESEQINKRNQIKKKNSLLLLLFYCNRGFLMSSEKSEGYWCRWLIVIASLCPTMNHRGYVLTYKSHRGPKRIRRSEFSDRPFVFLAIWIFSIESESLQASRSRLRIQRTLAASEDSNLEIKKKSPSRS